MSPGDDRLQLFNRILELFPGFFLLSSGPVVEGFEKPFVVL